MDALSSGAHGEARARQASWALECALLEHLAEVWDQPDHGIWERRGVGKQYVSSKVMAWVAFDRGIKSAERVRLRGAARTMARASATPIHRDVCDKGYDPRAEQLRQVLRLENARCQHPAAAVGRLPAADDPRVRGTMAAIEKTHDARRLRAAARSPRRRGRDAADRRRVSGVQLWLADAYVLAGDLERAQALFDRVVAVANDVGLLAEEYDSCAAARPEISRRR